MYCTNTFCISQLLLQISCFKVVQQSIHPQCSAVFALCSNVSHGEISCLLTLAAIRSSLAHEIRGNRTSALRRNCSLDGLYCISFVLPAAWLILGINRTFCTNPAWEYKVGLLQWQGETQGGFSAANSTSPLPDM